MMLSLVLSSKFIALNDVDLNDRYIRRNHSVKIFLDSHCKSDQ